MATHIQSTVAVKENTVSGDFNLIRKFNDFADSQTEWYMAWWVASLMIIGALFVPVTFLIVYSMGGPALLFLGISVVSFFASIIAYMGDMGIRTCLTTSFVSVFLHLAMIAITLAVF